MRFGSGGGLSGEVLPAPEDAADVAVGDAHGHDGHHVGQDEVEDVVSLKRKHRCSGKTGHSVMDSISGSFFTYMYPCLDSGPRPSGQCMKHTVTLSPSSTLQNKKKQMTDLATKARTLASKSKEL